MNAFVLVLGSVLLTTCSEPGPPPARIAAPVPPPPPTAPASRPETPSAGSFSARLAAIAGEYRAWGRVDDEFRWAPWLCRMPMAAEAHVSASSDSATHGDKLYSLFARDHAAYVKNEAAAGQVLVKESWKPERVADPKAVPRRFNARGFPDAMDADHFHPYAVAPDGGLFRAAERAGLFVMFKLPPGTPDTDEGWVYGTVTTTGEVTSAGRVESCMGCHREAPHDRLFGIQRPRVP